MKRILKNWLKNISFQGLSIQQRLPLLICVLLCTVILSFGFISYFGVRKAAFEMGKKRLHTLTDQMSSMFAQSGEGLTNNFLHISGKDSIKKFVGSGGKDFRKESIDILNKLRHDRVDSTWILVGILDSNKVPLLWVGKKELQLNLPVDSIFSSLSVDSASSKLGKFYVAGDSTYYPMVAPITNNKKLAGYLVAWRLLMATPQGLEQLSQLMGTGATLYLGNADGNFWTNLNKPFMHAPVDMKHAGDFLEYTDRQNKQVVAAVQPIKATQWLILIEFSKNIILETANRFLTWIIIAGSILIVLGIFLTWLMSHNIIRPINQLTNAATNIATGNFSAPVEVNRMDELGKLADAFNMMAQQIHITQGDLEKKISERTIQLEKANKELESFSYSISHDLRAPLRGIAGFTSLLETKYEHKFDDDAKRIMTTITNNVMKMSNLIDDLLSFSRTARHDIIKANISTDILVKEVIKDMAVTDQNISWQIQALPDSYGDINTMRQVWTNLISNAVKYSRNVEKPSIEIGSVNNEGQTVFFVKDNGVGFDPKYKDKLFKVFQRLHGANEFEGSGVGLAIVEKIISRHGGNIWVDAEKNKGAAFYFNLPTEKAQ